PQTSARSSCGCPHCGQARSSAAGTTGLSAGVAPGLCRAAGEPRLESGAHARARPELEPMPFRRVRPAAFALVLAGTLGCGDGATEGARAPGPAAAALFPRAFAPELRPAVRALE